MLKTTIVAHGSDNHDLSGPIWANPPLHTELIQHHRHSEITLFFFINTKGSLVGQRGEQGR